MLSMSASSAYGSASDKSGSCRRAGGGLLHPAAVELGAAAGGGGAGLLPCAEYGYTHICSAAPGPAAVLTRSCGHVHRRRSVSSLDALDVAAAEPGARPGAGGGLYERPGVTVECRVDCRTGVSGQLLPPPPPPLTAYCHDLDLVSTANDVVDDSPFNWPGVTA